MAQPTDIRYRSASALERVGFRYDPAASPAIDDLSLAIEPGECVALVGESGSGESTLLNLLLGFWRPQSGTIRLDGHPQDEVDLRAWRRRLAVVSQHTVLFSGSIRDNIAYGLEGVGDAAIEAAVDAAQLRTVVDALSEGLDTRIGENGLRLSGGQRQRLAIARALVRDPRISILDEAISALDVASEREVQRAIDTLIAGRTTIIVAHRLRTISPRGSRGGAVRRPHRRGRRARAVAARSHQRLRPDGVSAAG